MKSISTTLVAVVVLVVIVAAIAAVFLMRAPGGQEGAGEEKIVIGMPISLTGKYSVEGEMSLIGALAVIEWINEQGGVKVGGKTYMFDLKYYDDESNPDRVISLTERLITQDKVDFLISPYSSGLTFKAAPIADKNGVLMIAQGAASDKIFQQGYQYVVQVYTPGSRYLTSALDFVKATDPNAKKVAIIYKENEFSRTVAEGARKYAEQLGFQVVFYKSYPADVSDLTPILQELAASQPDIIIGGGHFQDGQLLAKQLAELNINAKLVSILVAPALPKFYEALGSLADGITYPAQWEMGVKYSPDKVPEGYEWYGPTIDEFLKYFTSVAESRFQKQGLKPSYHAAGGGAAVLMLAKALEMAGTTDTDAVRKAMNNLQIQTFFGKLKIDPETGLQIGHDMILGQWQSGSKVIIWPPEAANAEPIYPLPPWSEKG